MVITAKAAHGLGRKDRRGLFMKEGSTIFYWGLAMETGVGLGDAAG